MSARRRDQYRRQSAANMHTASDEQIKAVLLKLSKRGFKVCEEQHRKSLEYYSVLPLSVLVANIEIHKWWTSYGKVNHRKNLVSLMDRSVHVMSSLPTNCNAGICLHITACDFFSWIQSIQSFIRSHCLSWSQIQSMPISFRCGLLIIGIQTLVVLRTRHTWIS